MLIIPVYTIEAFGCPDKIGISAFSSREIKNGPGGDLFDACCFLFPVSCITFFGIYYFCSVSTNLVIQYDISININSIFLTGMDCSQIFRFCAIFGCNTAFLVKFAEVVQIIHRITDTVCTIGIFVSRR